MRVHKGDSNTWGRGQKWEDQKFEAILSYISNLRLARATRDLVFKKMEVEEYEEERI